jgi:hypothetical protein
MPLPWGFNLHVKVECTILEAPTDGALDTGGTII